MSSIEEGFEFLSLPESYTTADWQKEDLDYLIGRQYSANWSEMGCRKTTTGLWLAGNKTIALQEGNENGIKPIVLIVTTKSGKGTYFDAIPKCNLPFAKVFDIDATGADVMEFVGDQIFRFPLDPVHFWDASKQEKLPGPTLILAHYHCFMNKSKMLPFLKKLPYAMIIIDEAHRIKEKDNQWTRNIKALNCWTGYKHVMTGTGFINRPQEMW